ncbi:hypothetical protein AOA81_06320 [Methanomassiliicoccales archaeon RumEn M2]|nr:hypothetical protein AOA81_06320 [Methanomassiliicoccales archaeon RumEn M2]
MESHIENEMKFTCKGSDTSPIISGVLAFLHENQFNVLKQSEKSYCDHYFDSSDYQLFKNNCSARVRDYGNKMKMTIKIPVSNDGEVTSRREIESECNSFVELQSFVKSNYAESIAIKEVGCLRTVRNSIIFQTDHQYTITIDLCSMVSAGDKESFMEIEVESIDDDCRGEFELNGLQSYIVERLKFIPVNESKYSRLLKWTRSR